MASPAEGQLLHLRELKVAEFLAARGRDLIAQQQIIARRLGIANSRAATNANALLNVLVDAQQILDSHVDLLKRELAKDAQTA